ncbi:MAG: NAD(P)H-hydrate dehydratase [Myxococcales bacterium]|nr:NAD(P)H-hydrate dehydratase [Myxococcales bacterium]
MDALLTAAQMQALDRIAIDEVGIPSVVLMEVAGRGVLDATLALLVEAPGPVLVLAGTGNNGGDAVVVARHLVERRVQVHLLVLGTAEQLSADMAHQLRCAEALGVTPIHVTETDAVAAVQGSLHMAAVVIDGIFGTGLSRPIQGWRAELIRAVNEADVPVVAVDIPSGISADTGQVLGVAMVATVTVTFQCAKLGHVLHPGRAVAGDIQVADIGIPPSRIPEVRPQAVLIDDDIIEEAFPPRMSDSHKGTYGHVLVVAGVPDRPGAALLAARAAQRTGAGLVTLASDAETVRRLAPSFGSLMGLSVGEGRIDAQAVQDALTTRTALVLGPSLPPDAATAKMVQDVLLSSAVPTVLDAGALGALGADYQWLAAREGPTVLTPHPGEMARLLGSDSHGVQSDRVAAARHVATESSCVVILKGASTVVASPDGEVAVVVCGNPGMATGGTGDVLAGVVGSLLAQGVEPVLAARAAAHLHALAGDRAAEEVGETALLAEDVLRALGPALKALE